MGGENAKDSSEPKKDKHHNKLSEQIEKLTAEKDEVFAKLQRVSADYMNYQKRSARQVSEAIAYEKESVIKSLLPVLDNFEHSVCGGEKLEDAESLRKAIKMLYDQFLAILKNHGIEQITSVGGKFDPVCHQAMMNRTESDKEDFAILDEFQKGYRLGEKVLRPARVVVNKLPASESLPEQNPPQEQGEADKQPESDEPESGD
ncbi:MAG: nucleotide exchange factor GrpE [Phycisphaerae bacterium]|jgi:molecular chaperone GrpE